MLNLATTPQRFIATASVALLAALAITTAAPHDATAATLDATLVEDTYLDIGSASTNFSTGNELRLRTNPSVWRNPLIQFELPALKYWEEVSQVDLILTASSNAAGTLGTPDIEVLATTTAIDLATVTYNSAASDSLHNGPEATSALDWSGTWSDFSGESVIPGADFSVGQTITYTDSDAAAGLLQFIQNNSGTTPADIWICLGFNDREDGNSENSSTGLNLYSQESSGTAPILQLTTVAIPEPASASLLAVGGGLLAWRRRH